MAEYIIAKRTQPTAPKAGRSEQDDPKGLKTAVERKPRISFQIVSPEDFADLQKRFPGEFTEAK